MERNRNKSMGGGVNGLTTEVVLEMHGNIIDKQAGFPGLLTQYELQTRGVHTHRNIYRASLYNHKVLGFRPPSMRENIHPGIQLLDGC